jgi:hypothetical protein
MSETKSRCGASAFETKRCKVSGACTISASVNQKNSGSDCSTVRTPCCKAQSFPVHPAARGSACSNVTLRAVLFVWSARRPTISAVASSLWSSTTMIRNSPAYSCASSESSAPPIPDSSFRAGMMATTRGHCGGAACAATSSSKARWNQKPARKNVSTIQIRSETALRKKGIESTLHFVANYSRGQGQEQHFGRRADQEQRHDSTAISHGWSRSAT